MKWTLTIAAMLSLGIGLWAGFRRLTGALLAGCIGCGFLLFVANLDRISEFRASGTGVEAKTRDVLERAENTLSELQALGRIVAETTLSLIKRSGRLGRYRDEEAENIKASVLNVLKEIGVPESQHEDVLKEWHRFTEFDYVLGILGNRLPDGFKDPAMMEEWRALRSLDAIPSPQQLRGFLQKWNALTPEKEEYIKDYEYYVKQRTHRRPAVWSKRQEWGL